MPQSSVATCSTPTARASSSGPPARPPAALPRAVAHGAGLFGFRSEGCNPNGTFVRTLARPGPLPARVSDLRVTQAGEQTVRLEWTRPGAAAAGTLADRYRIVQRSASPPLVDFRPASRVVARGCPTPRPRAPAPPRPRAPARLRPPPPWRACATFPPPARLSTARARARARAQGVYGLSQRRAGAVPGALALPLARGRRLRAQLCP
jgi:hypothetical protein